ncbi:MAG TPA: type II secretion system protein GspE, partial [Candidatus Omnitrophica bacterium]|nr:type II secretion system protein GspE [Candidatus Omnitrophota bacterium]
MAVFKERLTELLVTQGILSKERLQEAFEIQKKKAVSLREVLLKEGFVDEAKLISVLSESLYIPTLNLSNYRIDASLAEVVPERMSRQYHLVPISRIGDNLTVAMADPLNIFALDDLRLFTGHRIEPVIALEKDILLAINNVYRHKEHNVSLLEQEKEAGGRLSQDTVVKVDDFRDQTNAAPIVKIINLMILEALKKRASDIHVEPQEFDVRIRYRIDGELADAFRIPKSNQNAIIARLKIISGLDTTETRLPQDGRFKIKSADKEVDFRVSSLPTSFGQKMVLRILDKSSLSLGLQRLGFSSQAMSAFNEVIHKPYGMILVTGPTGSGKSTTLYSVLSQLNTPEKNIITIEDPVEYQLAGISQIQVNSEISLDFASGLRSILRQSPDVILIGEIRDGETADIAVKAALTGHLVMSTLHTNNASQVITRLVDMGVEPFLVASSLIMSSAQRLIRLICAHCKEPDNDVSRPILKSLGLSPDIALFRGRGCRLCGNTGFYGRNALLEILMIDDIIKEMVVKGSSAQQIEDYAVSKLGMKTLRQEAI